MRTIYETKVEELVRHSELLSETIAKSMRNPSQKNLTDSLLKSAKLIDDLNDTLVVIARSLSDTTQLTLECDKKRRELEMKLRRPLSILE